jgi:hypothetical protein
MTEADDVSAAYAGWADACDEVERLTWRVQHPSGEWPNADVELICASQDVIGHRTTLNRAIEVARAARWAAGEAASTYIAGHADEYVGL